MKIESQGSRTNEEAPEEPVRSQEEDLQEQRGSLRKRQIKRRKNQRKRQDLEDQAVRAATARSYCLKKEKKNLRDPRSER